MSSVVTLGLNQSELPKIDEEFEAITEGEELTRKEKLKTKWPRSKRWSETRSGSTSSPLIWCRTTSAGSKRWKAGRLFVLARAEKAPRFLGTPSNFELTRK